MLAIDDFLLLRSRLCPGSERGRTAWSPDDNHRTALTVPHDPLRNGVLNPDSWRKIRKNAANAFLVACSRNPKPSMPCHSNLVLPQPERPIACLSRLLSA